MNEKTANAIRLEKIRDLYCRTGNQSLFLESYKRGNPEIPNFNTKHLWNSLNKNFIASPKVFPMAWERTKLIAKWIKNDSKYIERKPIKLLNIGFGSGILEGMMKNYLSDYYWVGVDIADKSVKKAQQLFPQGKFLCGDFLKVKFDTHDFDFIMCLEVIEHVSPPLTFQFYKKIRNLLKNRGGLFISVPINEGLEQMLENGNNPNAHVRIYTENILKNELNISKFEILKTKQLFAFNDFYLLKDLFARYFKTHSPNQVILKCRKI